MTRSLLVLPLLLLAACVESPPVMDPTVAPLGPTPDAVTDSPQPADRAAANDTAKSSTDRTINRTIRAAIVDDATIRSAKNVKIVTVDGKVTLVGAVASTSEKTAIEGAAKKVVGDGAVQDQLDVVQ